MGNELDELGKRLERASATDMASLAAWVVRHVPDRSAHTSPMAGGVVALTGRGMYVNCAIASGLDEPLTGSDLDRLEELSATVGAPSTVEASRLSDPSVIPLLKARGYRPGDTVRESFVQKLIGASPANDDHGFRIEVVETDEQLAIWQEAAARGWGHTTPEGRATSDLFAAGAYATQTPGLLVVRDRDDGRVVGASALSIHDGFAILGGMSTLPAERNRGVQQQCISHRLRLAIELGATAASVQAAPGSGSLRNIQRQSTGFTHSHTTTSWVFDA